MVQPEKNKSKTTSGSPVLLHDVIILTRMESVLSVKPSRMVHSALCCRYLYMDALSLPYWRINSLRQKQYCNILFFVKHSAYQPMVDGSRICIELMKFHKTAGIVADTHFKMPKNVWFRNSFVLKEQFLLLESSENTEATLSQ